MLSEYEEFKLFKTMLSFAVENAAADLSLTQDIVPDEMRLEPFQYLMQQQDAFDLVQEAVRYLLHKKMDDPYMMYPWKTYVPVYSEAEMQEDDEFIEFMMNELDEYEF